MPIAVILPRVDMDMETGRIARWLVEPGAAIRAGEALFEIETDKATMEIEAAAAGILRILVEASDADIKVGSVVAEILAAGEAERPEAAAIEPEPAEPPIQRATPLARRQASLRGIDLAAIAGSGPRGRVISRDIERQVPRVQGGPRREPTIVYLHGFAGNAGSWAPLRARLDPQFRHLAFDLPGHGDAAPITEATIEAVTEAVIATCRREADGPIHLVGHSLGGAIAARIAIAERLDIRSLLLIAPAGLGPEIDGDFIAGILRARSEASLRPWLERLFADPVHLRGGMIGGLLSMLTDPAKCRILAELAAHAFPDGTQSAALMVDTGNLAMPARIVTGATDRIIPFRPSPRIGAAVGLHVVPGVGHMPQIEAVPIVARIQAELLRSAGDAMVATDQETSRHVATG